jgi:ribonuclease HII
MANDLVANNLDEQAAILEVPVMPDIEWEARAGYPDLKIVGIDEVGRGCLAGPVVAAAVILPAELDFEKNPWILRIADSKKLTPETREELEPLILSWVLKSGIGVATVEEIDRINIHHACHLAMLRALEDLGPQDQPAHILIDGKFTPKELKGRVTAIVKGDDKCLSIAAASVIAKVWRDRHMASLDERYPGYSFGVHKGYGTPAHQIALKKLGPCVLHRRSFAPVAALLTKEEATLEFSF